MDEEIVITAQKSCTEEEPEAMPLFPAATILPQSSTMLFPSCLDKPSSSGAGMSDWLCNRSYTLDHESIFRTMSYEKEVVQESSIETLVKVEEPATPSHEKEKKDSKNRRRKRGRSHSPTRPPSPRAKHLAEQEQIASVSKKVFIEDVGLSPLHAFRVDRKPDRNNLAFTSLHHLVVAKYYRGMPCIGWSNSILEEEPQNKRKRKKRYYSPGSLEVLYSEEDILDLSCPKVLPERKTTSSLKGISHDYIPLQLSIMEDQPNLQSSLDINLAVNPLGVYDSVTTRYLHGKGTVAAASIGTESSIKETSSMLISRLTAEFNQKLREEPGNVSKWLEFVKFQDRATEVAWKQDDAEPNKTQKKINEKALLEKKLAILERAIENNPKSLELIFMKLQLCRDLWETEKLLQEWRSVLFLHPHNTLLWQHFLETVQCHFSYFTVSKLSTQFSKCMNMLTRIQEGTFVSHKPSEDLEEQMLEIVVKYCHFLRQCGYSEKAHGCFQALIEFNFFVPTTLSTSSPLEDWLALFEPFWDSGAPRFGEVGARGWSEIMKRKDLAALGQFDKDEFEEEDFIEVDQPLWKDWLSLERAREQRHWLPWRMDPNDDEQDCEDPDRVVLFEDVAPVLFRIHKDSVKVNLIFTFLNFLRISPKSLHLSTLCEALKCHVSTRIDSYDDLSIDNRLFLWSYRQTTDTPNCFQLSRTIPEPKSATLFIQGVFKQSFPLLGTLEKQRLSLLWAQFEISSAMSEPHDKQRKKRLKDVKGFLKSQLEMPNNRNNITLWTEFGILEWKTGFADKARKVFDVILGSHDHRLEADDASHQLELIRLYRIYAELEIGVQEGKFIHDGVCRSLWILCHLGAGQPYSPYKDPCSLTLVLKARRGFQVYLDILMKGYLANCTQTLQCNSDGTAIVEWTSAYAAFQYISCSGEEAFALYSSVTEWVEKQRREHSVEAPWLLRDLELLYLGYLGLLVLNNNTSSSPIRRIRIVLERALSFFPENQNMLRLFADLECKAHVFWRLRSYFNPHLKESLTPGCILATFAIQVEMERLRRLHDVYVRNIGELGIVHRVRSLFKKVMGLSTVRSCVFLWRAYMQFEVQHGDKKKVKAIFYQALQQCPWAKSLYVDAIAHLPEDIDEIMDIMTEKGIRMRTPMEEIALFKESARRKLMIDNKVIQEGNENIAEELPPTEAKFD